MEVRPFIIQTPQRKTFTSRASVNVVDGNEPFTEALEVNVIAGKTILTTNKK
jgi:hypothetical protein